MDVNWLDDGVDIQPSASLKNSNASAATSASSSVEIYNIKDMTKLFQ